MVESRYTMKNAVNNTMKAISTENRFDEVVKMINDIPFLWAVKYHEKSYAVYIFPEIYTTETGDHKKDRLNFPALYIRFKCFINTTFVRFGVNVELKAPFDTNGKKTKAYDDLIIDVINTYTSYNASERVLYIGAVEKNPQQLHIYDMDIKGNDFRKFLHCCLTLDVDKRGDYSFRLRPNQKTFFECKPWFSLDYEPFKKAIDDVKLENIGDTIEALFVNNFTKNVWAKKECLQWTHDTDMIYDGTAYQIKSFRATLSRLETLKNI